MRPIYSVCIFLFIPWILSLPLHAGSWRYHKVRPGESLSHIAVRYKYSVNDIIRWNKIRNPNHIKVNQILRIYKANLPIRGKVKNVPVFKIPVGRLQVLKGFRERGDERSYGIVARLPIGQPVKSAAKGQILKIDVLRGYGKFIMIDHGKGWITMYSNLDNLLVTEGEKINKGQELASANRERFFFLVSYEGKPVDPLKLQR
jgi:murein DD-endopeptidase MepM/ murein hydrolase activator NlpD